MWHPQSRNDGRGHLKKDSMIRCLLIGNSRWHWAEKHGERWHYSHVLPDPIKLKSLTSSLAMWAAVGSIPSESPLQAENELCLKDIPLKKLPPWLGIDRALGAWGALKRAQTSTNNHTGLRVADAGTVLSITRVTQNGAFSGGQLIGGLKLQLAAMANGAQKLHYPEIDSLPPEAFPYTTSAAMQRGTIQALTGALIEAQHEAKLPLWICGGDAPILIEGLRQRGLVVNHYPDLVLEGMVDVHDRIKQPQDL